jgi:hypothetical protein
MNRVPAEPDLSENTQARCVLPGAPPNLSPQLRAELEDWDRASAEALDLVERLACEAEVAGAAGVKGLGGSQEGK